MNFKLVGLQSDKAPLCYFERKVWTESVELQVTNAQDCVLRDATSVSIDSNFQLYAGVCASPSIERLWMYPFRGVNGPIKTVQSSITGTYRDMP